MIDYIRSQNVSFEAKNLNNITSISGFGKICDGASCVLNV